MLTSSLAFTAHTVSSADEQGEIDKLSRPGGGYLLIGWPQLTAQVSRAKRYSLAMALSETNVLGHVFTRKPSNGSRELCDPAAGGGFVSMLRLGEF